MSQSATSPRSASSLPATTWRIFGSDYRKCAFPKYPHIEYLVMVGGSSDGTVSLLERYGDRLGWVSQPDRGQADAINRGFRRTNGSIFAFLNADDLYCVDAIEKVVDAFEKHPEAGVIYRRGRPHRRARFRRWGPTLRGTSTWACSPSVASSASPRGSCAAQFLATSA